MGTSIVTPPKVKAQSLHCPNCGGAIQLRGFAHSLTAVCTQCLTILDASTPTLTILQKIQAKMRRTPEIPLGSRGKFGDIQYEAIGFQCRQIHVDNTDYEWDEYLLFNPYRGFIYLTNYRGHWNVVRVIPGLPELKQGLKPVAQYAGQNYRHFQSSTVRTIFVLGEFPWRVRVGETVKADDYTNPPYLLSSEETGNEVTWSLSEYVEGSRIWQAFNLKDQPRAASGIYVNQPNPKAAKVSSAWRLFMLVLVATLVLAIGIHVMARNETVLNERHHFYPGQTGEQSFVTPVFDLKGHESNVVVQTRTDVQDNWMFLNYALINSDTGKAYDFGREISYYYDSDGSEGSKNDTVTIPAVPPGKYYLRVEPEGDAKNSPIEYDIVVRRDVPSNLFIILALIALVIPPIVTSWRSHRFEYNRWQESDYAGGSSSSSSSGDDD